MYSITVDGEVIALCDKPRYVKIKKESESYIECSAEEALGISVDGELYNINYKTDIPDRPLAFISEKDNCTVVFKNVSESSAGVKFQEQQMEFDLDADYRLTCLELGI